MHQKPTVFFSHSSVDQDPLRRLRNTVVAKTGSTIDVFLSSDGQSIPLGRNWVYRVEEALAVAKLMFVFVSPASLLSGWVFFESGYAYSRGIRVVPIGIHGVDLGRLDPPLSLLQGFNISSPDTVSNIIAVVNEEFHFNFPASLTQEEYSEIFGHDHTGVGAAGHFAILIDSVSVTPHADGDDLLAAARRTVEEEGIEHFVDEQALSAFGLSIHRGERMGRQTSIDLDPTVLHRTLPIISRIFSSLGDRPASEQLTILFSENVAPVSDATQQTGRLFGTGVRLAAHDRFAFDDLEFTVSRWYRHGGSSLRSGGASINLHVPHDRLAFLDLKPLLELLFDRDVLKIEGPRDPAMGA